VGSSWKVAFATNTAWPDSTPDDRLAISELESLGVHAIPAIWDEPSVDWAQFSAVILRSTWDYFHRPVEFLDWVDRTSRVVPMWNPPDVVRWNAHKGYLADLARGGAAVVPTELVPFQSSRTLASILSQRGWSEVVVKPAVGANAQGLRVVRRHELEVGEESLRTLLSKGDALVQPLLQRVGASGERSLVFFEGTFSHAASYPFVLNGGPRTGAKAEIEARTREQATRVVERLPRRPLYARVDLLPAEEDGWLMSELELIEPHLFLGTEPEAPRRFANAILGRLGRPG